MTNYKERLDEILDIHDNLVLLRQAAGDNGNELRDTTKQALTSLIKELVAEAKPGTWVDPEDTNDPEWRGYTSGVNEFEQNLLKELEEK